MLSMGNLARIAKVIALLLFVLPWVTISCAEQTLVSMSGVDLVTGHISMTNPMTGATESPPGMNGGDLFVMIGAALIVLSLIATFVLKGGKGWLVAAVGSAAAAICLAYTVLVRIPGEARANPAAAAGGGGGAGGPTPEQIAQMIQIHVQIGFWLVLAALAAAVVLNVLAMKGGAAPVAVAVPAPPPPPDV
ncbi:MAG: hypothetical protein QOG13_2935 [Sphingomonadales bacterium]|jgi:hypothetical protein|nr:hypothetical protein [Sphingomonadales bacterium]MEA3043862.1 hypothetical protein [Sphingomonadales bacterium]